MKKEKETQFFIVMKKHTKINVYGMPISVVDPDQGIVGFCPIFDDHKKAIAFADGDETCVLPIRISR